MSSSYGAKRWLEALQYFCPSKSVVSDDENKVWFSRERKKVKEFTIDVDGVTCEVNFVISSKGSWGYAHSNMEAVTEIHITFPETNNLVFYPLSCYMLSDYVQGQISDADTNFPPVKNLKVKYAEVRLQAYIVI